jgi:hypothetical protein
LSDDQLAAYVEIGERVYDPDAVAFAREELDRRKIDPRLLTDAKAFVQKVDEQEIARANAPLESINRIVAVMCAMAIFTPVGYVLWLRMQRRGEYRRSRELRFFGAIGFGLWLILIGVRYDHAFLGLAGAALIALVFLRHFTTAHFERKRLTSTHCIVCGYDLRATPERCPECGTEVKSWRPTTPPARDT